MYFIFSMSDVFFSPWSIYFYSSILSAVQFVLEFNNSSHDFQTGMSLCLCVGSTHHCGLFDYIVLNAFTLMDRGGFHMLSVTCT